MEDNYDYVDNKYREKISGNVWCSYKVTIVLYLISGWFRIFRYRAFVCAHLVLFCFKSHYFENSYLIQGFEYF